MPDSRRSTSDYVFLLAGGAFRTFIPSNVIVLEVDLVVAIYRLSKHLVYVMSAFILC